MVSTEASEALRTGLRGPVVAMTTPFTDDGTIDTRGLRELTRFYNKSDIDCIVAAGSSGEFFSLTDEERRHVIKTVTEESNDDMLVLGGCAHSGTRLAADLVTFSERVGADGALVSPPYYAFSGFEGIKRHFRTISDQTNIGICVYFSGTVLQFPIIEEFTRETRSCPREMRELAAIPNVGAFKDSSSDYGFHKDVTSALDGPDGEVAVMGSNGMEYHLWGYLAGSRTFLSGLGNIWPSVEVQFFEHLEEGNFRAAYDLVDKYERDYLHTTIQEVGPGKYWPAVKALLDMRGLPGRSSRSPMVDVTEEERNALGDMVERTGLSDIEV